MSEIKLNAEALEEAGAALSFVVSEMCIRDRLEECEKIREGFTPDGVRPSPCVGCENGMRFKPCEEPQCEEFVQGDGLNNG